MSGIQRLMPVVLAAGLLAAMLAPSARAEGPAQITVTGTGEVAQAPDMAMVTLGVTAEGATAAAALRANSAALTRVLTVLKAAKIEDRDIQTSGLQLGPVYANSDGSMGNSAPRIRAFVAENTVTVRVRAIDGLGTLLDGVVADEAGANLFRGIDFGLQDPKPALDKARAAAVADARHRAEIYATAAGLKLGQVVSISDAGGYEAPQFKMRTMAAAADSVPVSGGEVSSSASVTVVYQLQ